MVSPSDVEAFEQRIRDRYPGVSPTQAPTSPEAVTPELPTDDVKAFEERIRRKYPGALSPTAPTSPPDTGIPRAEPHTPPSPPSSAAAGVTLPASVAADLPMDARKQRAAAAIARQGYAPPDTGIPPFNPTVEPNLDLVNRMGRIATLRAPLPFPFQPQIER